MAKKILIVEDNELNAKLFTDLLNAQGYITEHSSDGHDLLDLCENFMPDLILMDIQLPQISGIELIKILKSNLKYQTIPIIAVTAFAMRGDEEKIMSSGCDAYLSKPIAIDGFLRTIKDILAKKDA